MAIVDRRLLVGADWNRSIRVTDGIGIGQQRTDDLALWSVTYSELPHFRDLARAELARREALEA